MAGESPVIVLNLITTQIVDIKFDMSLPTKSVIAAEEKVDWLEVVQRQVASLRYGVVQIVIHDAQVTQIEKTERVRLDKPRSQTI